MKKLLLTLLLPLSIISSASYGEEINSLFGITLYGNAENYVSSNYIASNKVENQETIEGFFDLGITDDIKTKSPYITNYWISIDDNNTIHEIYGENELINLDICKAVKEYLSSKREEKYQIDMEYSETPYASFKIYSYYYYDNENDYFTIQCKETFGTTLVYLQIYTSSIALGVAKDEYYESGL